MMEGRFVHWCAIETGEATTGSKSAYGGYSTVVTTESTRCIFKSGRGGRDLESGAFVTDLPNVILPATTSITAGDRLVGVSSGWVGNYVVKAVRTVWNRCGIDHISADLEVAP